jgi:hypothetical protein
MIPLRSLVLAAALAVSSSAFAHTDDWFDANPSANGGQIRMAGPYHFELMPSDAKRGVRVLVTDHGNGKIATAGWSASAVVLAAGKKRKLDLKPAGNNELRAQSVIPAGAKVVVSVKDKEGREYSARFTPGAKAAPSAAAPADAAVDHSQHQH